MCLLPTLLTTVVLFGGATGAALAQEQQQQQQPLRDENRDVEIHRLHDANAQRDANAARDFYSRVVTGATTGEHRKGAYLGVATSPPTPILREQLKLSEGMGLVVEFVDKESPAEKAGIRRYDVLTKLEDQLLVNAEQLAVLVRSKKPGDDVELTLIRGGTPSQLKAKLVERELAPLEDAMFFRGPAGGGPDGRAFLDWQVRQMPPELREWWRSHPPGKHKDAHGDADPHRDAHGDAADTHGQAKAGARAGAGQSVTSWSDNEHTLTVTTESGKPGRHLVAKDRNGAVLFDGDLDAPGARDKLPTILKGKLEKMEAAGVKPPKAPEPNVEENHLLPTDDANGI